MTIKNPNHPKKGSTTKVGPIRKIQDIKAIIKLLHDKPKEQLLFTLGVNNGLRAGDLLLLQVKQVKHLKTGDTLEITESKTGKKNVFIVNKTVKKYLSRYLAYKELDDDSYLFFSQKQKDQPICISHVNRLVKSWCKAINLKGNYGAHTLRKTWGYIKRTRDGVGFEVIAKRFNHSNPSITMRYLGIQDKEVYSALMDDIC